MSIVADWLARERFTFTVTGGAGFIGSNLAIRLLKAGHAVRIVDNLATGLVRNLSELEIAAKESQAEYRFIEGSVTDEHALTEAFTGSDFVLHQAALGSVPRSIDDPWASHEANVDGTLKVFIAARKAKVRRVVYASSSSVYGNSEVRPNREGHEAEPLSPYAVTKKINELYGRNFSSVYGQSLVGLRYFNVFGPRQDPNSRYAAVIPKFIKGFLTDQAPTVFGDGETSRDFTYVDNVVDANLLACRSPEKIDGEIFNIACSGTHSLNDLVSALQRASGCKLAAVYAPARAGDIRFSQANILKARERLGYEPSVDFDEGLRRTYAWWQANRSFL